LDQEAIVPLFLGTIVFIDVMAHNSYHYFIFYTLLCFMFILIPYICIATGESFTLAYFHPLNTIENKVNWKGSVNVR
jgi:hypothetical protein